MKLNYKIINIISILLIVLLLLCLLDMPYGFYQLVRLIAAFGFALLAYYEYLNKRIPLAIGFSFLALLFQPFVKIALGRMMWNIVDIIVAIFLTLYLFNLIKHGWFINVVNCGGAHSKM